MRTPSESTLLACTSIISEFHHILLLLYFFFFKLPAPPRDLPSSPPRPSPDLGARSTPSFARAGAVRTRRIGGRWGTRHGFFPDECGVREPVHRRAQRHQGRTSRERGEPAH